MKNRLLSVSLGLFAILTTFLPIQSAEAGLLSRIFGGGKKPAAEAPDVSSSQTPSVGMACKDAIGSLTPPDYFVGRLPDLDLLTSSLQAGENVLLFGEARVGKSSLVRALSLNSKNKNSEYSEMLSRVGDKTFEVFDWESALLSSHRAPSTGFDSIVNRLRSTDRNTVLVIERADELFKKLDLANGDSQGLQMGEARVRLQGELLRMIRENRVQVILEFSGNQIPRDLVDLTQKTMATKDGERSVLTPQRLDRLPEPEALSILAGIRERMEETYKVVIPTDALTTLKSRAEKLHAGKPYYATVSDLMRYVAQYTRTLRESAMPPKTPMPLQVAQQRLGLLRESLQSLVEGARMNDRNEVLRTTQQAFEQAQAEYERLNTKWQEEIEALPRFLELAREIQNLRRERLLRGEPSPEHDQKLADLELEAKRQAKTFELLPVEVTEEIFAAAVARFSKDYPSGMRGGMFKDNLGTADQSTWLLAEKPNVHWDSVKGLERAKRVAEDRIFGPALFPALARRLGVVPNIRAILFGPPGGGKTMFGKALATRLDAKVYLFDVSKLVNPYVGVSEMQVQEFFANVKRDAKTGRVLVLIDEAEGIFARRGGGGNYGNRVFEEMQRAVLKNLSGMEEIGANVDVIVMTNRIDAFDAAVLSRFPVHIYVPRPNLEARTAILTDYLASSAAQPVDPAVKPQDWAMRLDGWSGRDIQDSLIPMLNQIRFGALKEQLIKQGIPPEAMENPENIENVAKQLPMNNQIFEAALKALPHLPLRTEEDRIYEQFEQTREVPRKPVEPGSEPATPGD